MPDNASTQVQTKGAVQYDASAAIVFTGQAQRALTNASDFTVDSPDMLAMAGEDLQAVKALQKKVEEQRTSVTGPMNAALRAINDLFRPPSEYLKQAEDKLKTAMLTYTTEQERIAAEARRRAEEAARIERDRLAEIQRQQEEAARAAAQAAERAAREAAEAAARGDAEAAAKANAEAAAQAQAAEQANADAQASAVTAEVISMPPAVVEPARVSGISTSKSVDFEVTSLLDLVQFVAANPEHIGLVMADSVKLRAQVRATGLLTKLPGVRVFTKRTMSARAA